MLSNYLLIGLTLIMTIYIVFALVKAYVSTMPSHITCTGPKEVSIIAGKVMDISLNIKCKDALNMVLMKEAPIVKIDPLELNNIRNYNVLVRIKPQLGIPSQLKITARVFDIRRLIERDVELLRIKLNVIPRATVASWLIREELMARGRGRTITVEHAIKPHRIGIEYYSSREYMPGDIPRYIDWKKTVKIHKLFIKEFGFSYESPVMMFINSNTSNLDEADKLSFLILMLALTLYSRGLKVGFTIFRNGEMVKLISPTRGKDILINALKILDYVVIENYSRFAEPYLLLEVDISKDTIRNLISLRKTRLTQEYERKLIEVLENEGIGCVIHVSDDSFIRLSDMYLHNILRARGLRVELYTTRLIP